nr:hypothetical protein [Woeseiaceae bacterium]
MTRDLIQLTVVCVACTIIALLAPPAAAQTSYPEECKPVGSDSCRPVELTDFQYQAQLCESAFYFPSEPTTAAHFFSETFVSAPGCPATQSEFLRWADNETRTASGGVPDPDFTV